MENNSKFKKRILFFGMPDMGSACLAKLAQAGVNIVGVVPPAPNEPSFYQFCDLVKYFNLPLLPYRNSLKDADFLERIKALKPDLAVVCSYSKLFPRELLATVPNGFVNVHPSLLPEYRGANPYSHVIINNESKTGVSLHFMDEHFDTGDVIVAREVPLDPNETMGTIFNRLNFMSAELLFQFLQHFETGEPIKRFKQPEGEYKKASSIGIAEGNNKIDWTKDAAYIERFVRALNPFITAITYFRGMPVKVFKVRVLDKKINAPAGMVLNVEKGLFVNSSNGIVELKIVQPGSFFLSDGRDFVQKFDIKKGDIFTNG